MKRAASLITLFLVIVLPSFTDCMIITSVIGGPKKYNTVSFDLFPIPLAFAVPNKLQLAYRGHYTFRRPLFNIQSSMPVALPMDFFPPSYAAPSQEDPYNAEPTEEEEQQDTALESNTDPSEEPVIADENGDILSNSVPAVKLAAPSLPPAAPRPYTGKAQVSSFIDNGQFVNANTKSVQDAAFGDEADNQSDERLGRVSPPFDPATEVDRRTILKDKGKTVSMGYEHKFEPIRKDPIAVHNRHPDSMPWGFSYDEMQKYYTTFQFTDSFRTPGTYWPIKDKKSLLASLLLG